MGSTTPLRLRALLTLTGVAIAALAGCSTAPDAPQRPAPAPIGRFASANPGSVNVFWFTAPQGLVLVDTGRTLTDARSALVEIRETGSPVAAILITHPHPDHVGGIGVFHDAYPTAPIFASTTTDTLMRTDPLGFYPLTRSLPGADFPAELTYPDHTFEPGATIDVAGTRLETAEFAPGESESATAYLDPATGTLYAGDLVGNRVTPALLEGHTCGWLTNLDRLAARFPSAQQAYPGHGDPASSADLIGRQREYLQFFRGQVADAEAPGSGDGSSVSPAETQTITSAVNRRYPGYPLVASLPTLVQENIKGVAGELQKQPTCAG